MWNDIQNLARHTIQGIVRWADAHHRRTGCWPTDESGPVTDAPGETWAAIDMALRAGLRGLRGGTSLAKLLRHRRRVRAKALPQTVTNSRGRKSAGARSVPDDRDAMWEEIERLRAGRNIQNLPPFTTRMILAYIITERESGQRLIPVQFMARQEKHGRPSIMHCAWGGELCAPDLR